MDGRRSTLIELESDSSTNIGIFLLMSNQSWMNDCHPFPISKWRNPTQSTLCLGMPSPARYRIGTTNWKGCQFWPMPHWKTPCACTNWWFAWCAGRCCTTWSGYATQLQYLRSSLRTKSNQDGADIHLTRPRWSVTTPPWRAHATQ